jgi:hypothetical protein
VGRQPAAAGQLTPPGSVKTAEVKRPLYLRIKLWGGTVARNVRLSTRWEFNAKLRFRKLSEVSATTAVAVFRVTM